jgi:molybdopterin/thiamine biosynthesis adenylyltransferase
MNRYTRNILIKEIGEEGQKKLGAAKVLVIGAGGLGSPVLSYLAAAGVGTLGIVDYDVVDITNLQRQFLHYTPNLGELKTKSAQEKLQAFNPEICIQSYTEKFTSENAETLIAGYDFVIDCSDNYETKFLINDVCVRLQRPYSHGAILALQGEVMTYVPGTACYRCVFGEAPEKGTVLLPSQAGVLGAVAGVIGSIQATECIKYITGVGSLLINRLLLFDAKSMTFTTLKVKKKEACC